MTNATNPTFAALTANTIVKVEKGCRARNVDKGVTAVVKSVQPLGAEYSHGVRVVLTFRNGFSAGKDIVLFARHPNRLSDFEVSLNDGRPEHKIVVRRAH